MAQPSNSASGIDNTYRRKWDREEYLERARERDEEEDGRFKAKAKVPPVQRKPLKHRDYEVDLVSRLGKTQVVTPVAPLSQQAGYYCSVCECVVKDSANYLDHINGKKTSESIGHVDACGEGIIGTGPRAVWNLEEKEGRRQFYWTRFG
jgi:U4/U6.U5 tri-snRNP component SNU23